jgi:hypothetical protein
LSRDFGSGSEFSGWFQFTYELDLPDGADLKGRDDGGASIVSAAGEASWEVPSPTAVDAQGASVPVDMRIDGRSLVLDVPHAKRDVAYPILVDPGFSETHEESPPFEGWIENETDPDYVLTKSGSSLLARTLGSKTKYSANTHGQWEYLTPGTTSYIESATFSSVSFFPNGCGSGQPHGYTGIYDYIAGSYNGHLTKYTEVKNNVTSSVSGAGYGTNKAIVGIGTGESATELTCAHELWVGAVTVKENDAEKPTIISMTGVPSSGWIGPGFANVKVVATDDGFGITLLTMDGRAVAASAQYGRGHGPGNSERSAHGAIEPQARRMTL